MGGDALRERKKKIQTYIKEGSKDKFAHRELIFSLALSVWPTGWTVCFPTGWGSLLLGGLYASRGQGDKATSVVITVKCPY